MFLIPQCFPVKPHGKHCFQQQNMYLLRGRNISPCGKTEKHWENMCPQQMSLSTCLLVLPSLIFLKAGDRGAASHYATPYVHLSFPSIIIVVRVSGYHVCLSVHIWPCFYSLTFQNKAGICLSTLRPFNQQSVLIGVQLSLSRDQALTGIYVL